MTAEEARQHLSAYLDGELSDGERRDLEALLATEPALRAELEELRRAIELIRSLPKQKAPSGFAQRVREAIAAQRVPRRRLTWLRPVALAAAACLAVAFAALLLSGLRSPRGAARRVPAADEAMKRAKEEGAGTRSELAARAAAARRTGVEALAVEKKVAPLAEPEAPRPKATAPARGAGGTDRALLARKGAPPVAKSVPGGRRSVTFAAKAGAAPAPARLAKGGARAPARQYARQALPSSQRVRYPGAEGGEEVARLGRRELLDAIMRPREAAEARRRVASPRPLAPPAKARGAGIVHLEAAYRDLEAALDRVAEAFERAGVSYAIQPLGSGEFVVEASAPRSVASELARRLAALTGRTAGEQKEAALRDSQRSGQFAQAPARQREAATVRLTIRFAPAVAQGAPAGGRQR